MSRFADCGILSWPCSNLARGVYNRHNSRLPQTPEKELVRDHQGDERAAHPDRRRHADGEHAPALLARRGDPPGAGAGAGAASPTARGESDPVPQRARGDWSHRRALRPPRDLAGVWHPAGEWATLRLPWLDL